MNMNIILYYVNLNMNIIYVSMDLNIVYKVNMTVIHLSFLSTSEWMPLNIS